MVMIIPITIFNFWYGHISPRKMRKIVRFMLQCKSIKHQWLWLHRKLQLYHVYKTSHLAARRPLKLQKLSQMKLSTSWTDKRWHLFERMAPTNTRTLAFRARSCSRWYPETGSNQLALTGWSSNASWASVKNFGQPMRNWPLSFFTTAPNPA